MTFITLQRSTSSLQPTLVFLAGWGFDGQVGRFGMWPDNVTVLAPSSFSHAGLIDELYNYLEQEGIGQIILVGWSMGAHLAWDFSCQYPQRVAGLNLLAGRRSWPSAAIASLKADLQSDFSGLMTDFYRKSFLGHKALYRQFVGDLQDEYLQRLDGRLLADGLDYLASHPLSGQVPDTMAVQVIHGQKDVVAPYEDRPQLAGAQEKSVAGGGHLLFAQAHSYLL